MVTKGKLTDYVSLAQQDTDSYEKREHLLQELVLPLSTFIMMWTGNSGLYNRLRQSYSSMVSSNERSKVSATVNTRQCERGSVKPLLYDEHDER